MTRIQKMHRTLQSVLAGCAVVLAVSSAQAQGRPHWTSAGQSISNARHQRFERKLDRHSVEGLEMKWSVETGGDVSATPSIDGKFVYFPDFGGNLFKVHRDTGEVVWTRQVSEYTGVPGSISRNTPTIHGDLLVFGDQGGRLSVGASMMAVDKHTGDLVWITKIEPHPAAVITQSPTIFRGRVYVGVSSLEEGFATIPGYNCCSFRGSMAALDLDTGEVLWRTYTAAEGFSGNAVWGSAPAIDVKRNQVYIATGNNYSAPPEFLVCVYEAGDDIEAQRACLEPYPDNFFDAVLALDLDTGAVNWVNLVVPFDVWTVACVFEMPNCPEPEGPDFDFGQAPVLYGFGKGREKRELIGVGQKSGEFWSLDPDTGATVWSTQLSPGGTGGGMMWGSAFDGERLYTSSANSELQPWTLIDGTDTSFGIWSALDPKTGEILWQTANPAEFTAGGAVSVANGVVYACSQDPAGHMYALDARTGEVLWDFVSGGSCNAGAAIVGGTVFWGSGYAGFGPPNTSNNVFYAFGLPE